ncbi:MAG: cation-transporting P-type ATPase [Synechococcaceae bacterium WB4_1_0192]|nr:cation-transporting P-type ATPase [Synechococcaceae bacterium WB4_1_0192]
MQLSADQPIWCLTAAQVFAALQSQPEGLSSVEAIDRLERFGPNRLPSLKRRPLALRFSDQLLHFMALLLWVAGALAFIARAPQLGWAIWAVILINALFSFWQEFKAERTLQALAGNLPDLAQVWRDGQLQQLSADQLVCGDVVLLEEGNRVPADCRLLTAEQLYLDLAVLTGESLPVARAPGEQPAARLPSRERTNLLLAGATVVSGRAEAIVYATASETEFGQVAHLTASTERSTSTLELQIERIVHTITLIALSTGLLTFTVSVLLERMAPLESLIYAVGIIVGFVPEGLLPQVTLTLALNVQRMARRQALVRRLSAVESLGSVSVICSDKTGTITQNRMAVEACWLPGPDQGAEAAPQESGQRQLLLLAASLCSNARLEDNASGSGPWRASGDPTETALLIAAAEADLLTPERQGARRCRELPFDSHRRRLTVVIERLAALPGPPLPAGNRLALTKGAPLELLERCSGWLGPTGLSALTEPQRQEVVQANDRLAEQGFRVLAVAVRSGGDELLTLNPEGLESGLTLVGLVGLYDPPRPEVLEAIRQCRQAGIKVTMVTGDYGVTAQAIAQQIGLLEPMSGRDTPAVQRAGGGADPVRVIDGATLAQISDLHLRRLLKYRTRLVFARMAPEQKLRLVQAYRDLGEVVAVTGDGVNDAPALRAADVGVAMGRCGTDVAREAADIVLLDDNFATIVEAVRFGRGVISNIRKFLTYILVANLSEAAPFLAMVSLRIPAALTVMQILAVDLGTDILPALGLGAELPEAALMHQPPRPRQAPLLDRSVLQRSYLFLGLMEASFSLAAYLLVWLQGGVSLAELQALAPQLLQHTAPEALQQLQLQASAAAFTTIVFSQVGVLLACRSEWRSGWSLLGQANPLLWCGAVSELVLLAALVLTPMLSRLLAMAPFPARDLTWMALAPVLILLADDGRKRWLQRHG